MPTNYVGQNKIIASNEEKEAVVSNMVIPTFEFVSTDDLGTTTVTSIVYKELNPLYRELLNLNSIETIMQTKIPSGDRDYLSGIEFNQAVRAATNVDDYLISNIDNNSTLLLFKYQYGNSYTARMANESDIMIYYYGDNYISNNYGTFKYQIEEIDNFLKIYKETRDSFYA